MRSPWETIPLPCREISINRGQDECWHQEYGWHSFLWLGHSLPKEKCWALLTKCQGFFKPLHISLVYDSHFRKVGILPMRLKGPVDYLPHLSLQKASASRERRMVHLRSGYQWPKIGACIQRQKYLPLTFDVLKDYSRRSLWIHTLANVPILGVGSDSGWRTSHLGDGQESPLGLIINWKDSICSVICSMNRINKIKHLIKYLILTKFKISLWNLEIV